MGPGGPRRARQPGLVAAAAFIALLLAPPPAGAKQVAFPYSDDDRHFLICGAGIGGPSAAADAAVLALGARTLPGTWRLDSPVGSGVISAAMLGRYSEYDVILLDGASLDAAAVANGGVLLSPVQDALVQLADCGVMLWIDYPAGGAFVPGPCPRLASFAPGAAGAAVADPTHPLLLEPFRLTAADVALLSGLGTFGGVDTTLLPPVLGPNIYAGEYGSGAVVLSVGLTSLLTTPPVAPAARKFAYNVLEWSNRWTQDRADPRHSGVVNLTVEPPLETRWQAPSAFGLAAPLPPVLASPVLSRGLLYVAAGSSLLAFDADPAQDLDGDGLGDEGLADWSVGLPYDAVWAAALAGAAGYAAPCTATIGGTAPPTPVVVASSVGGGTGTVQCFNGLTGALVWTYTDTVGAYAGASTVWVSSPVVHKGYVYFIAQDAAGYTRAHALDLATGGAASSWAYPHAGFEPAPAGPLLLPPAVDPAGAFPTPGPVPAVSSSAHVPDGTGTGATRLLDTVLSFGTWGRLVYGAGPPVTWAWAGPGGCVIALAPTPPPTGAPLRGPNFDLLTGMTYFSVEASGVPNVAQPVYQDDNSTPVPAAAYAPMAANALTFDPAWARAYLANLAAPGAPPPPPRGSPGGGPVVDPLGWREGRKVILTVGSTPEALLLRGPVLWCRNLGVEAAGKSHTVDLQTLIAAADVGGAAGGTVFAYQYETEHGAFRLRWIPGLGSPLTFTTRATAAAGNTAYLLSNAESGGAPAFMGLAALRIDAEQKMRLGSIPDAGTLAVTLGVVPPFVLPPLTLLPGGVIPPTAYDVDEQNQELIFDAALCAQFGGLPVTVDYTSGGAPVSEPHAMPDPRRWEHAPGLIKTKYPIAGVANIYLADAGPGAGTAVAGFTAAANGLVDLTAATCAALGGAPGAVMGHEVEVHYVGWSEDDLGPVNVGAPGGVAGVTPPERHLVPSPIGATLGAPSVSGDTVHAGGYNGVAPLGAPGLYTVHSARWNKSGSAVYGHDAIPALTNPATAVRLDAGPTPGPTPRRPSDLLSEQLSIPLFVDVSAAEAVPARGARVYPPIMDGLLAVAGAAPEAAPTLGFVSVMAPPRTLIADNARIVEAKGAEVEWEATGTVAYPNVPSMIATPPAPGTPPPPRQFRPFVHPAKATMIDGGRNIWEFIGPFGAVGDFRDAAAQAAGHILVVDTGNNRVVEIDRDGDIIWPLEPVLDSAGDLLWQQEMDLGLDSPSDAYRWVSPGPVYHTVIADTGNARLVHVATTVNPDLTQAHVFAVASPTHLLVDLNPFDADPTPTRLARVAYSQVLPLFDVAAGGLIGYVCAAVNLHRLIVIDATGAAPTGYPLGGPFTYVQWLYDRNLDGVPSDPLVFEDIKHIALSPRPRGGHQRGIWPYGGPLHLTVTASRYANPPPGGLFATTWDATAERAGCFEFDCLAPALGEPVWHFTQRDHVAYGGALTTLTTPGGGTMPKPFLPMSAQRLDNGSHIICNGAAQRANVTRANFPGQNTEFSQVVRVLTDYTVADNAPGQHLFGFREFVPCPRLRAWAQPLNQPAYAERY